MPLSILNRLIPALFLCSLLAFSTPAYCQFELRSATVITQTDTLLGQVKFYDWDISPKAIEFINAGGVAQTLPAREIKRAVIAPGIVYEGHTVSFSTYDETAPSIKAALEGHPTTDYLLLELLTESEAVRFYRFTGKKEKKRFFLEKAGIVYPLDNINVFVITKRKQGNYENPLYRDKLKQLLGECPTLRTDNLDYNEKDMMVLLREYHLFCRIDNREFREQPNVGKVKISLGLLTSTFLTNRRQREWGDTRVSQIGVSLQLLSPKRFSNFFAHIDAARMEYSSNRDDNAGFNIALLAGRYFGKGALQGSYFTGVSLAQGPFETGVGLAYKKTLSVSASLPLFLQITEVVRGTGVFFMPAINFRLHLPLSKQSR